MNYSVSANLAKSVFYVCPTCHNVLHTFGLASITCCEELEPLVAQVATGEHVMSIARSEGDLYVSLEHPMTKEHHISFVAFVKPDRFELVKLYPESAPETRLAYRGRGELYAYCITHGLFRQAITHVSPERP